MKNNDQAALKALARVYFSRQRDGWENGETEDEVMDHLVATMCNAGLDGWPSDYDLKRTLNHISRLDPCCQQAVEQALEKGRAKIENEIIAQTHQLDGIKRGTEHHLRGSAFISGLKTAMTIFDQVKESK